MGKNILFILLLIATSAKSQLKDSTQVDFHISCGFIGITSPEVQNVHTFTLSKNYIFLRKKLFSNNKAEAILSAISLYELHANKQLTLNADDQNRINEIKKWDYKYLLCYTCTVHLSGFVYELFQDNGNEAYKLIRNALFESD